MHSEFHRFRLLLASRLFCVDFDMQASFFEASGAVAKIGLSLKSNHHCQI